MNLTLVGTKVTQDTKVLAFEKDNKTSNISLTVDTTGWDYKLYVEYPKDKCSGEQLYNIVDFVNTSGNIYQIVLTSDMLPFNGKYTVQLKGVKNDNVYHSQTFEVWVKRSIDPSEAYNPIPTEFEQIEQRVTELNNNPPYPSNDGFWMIYNVNTHAYVKSTIPVVSSAGAVRYNTAQSLTDVEKQTARSNIGASDFSGDYDDSENKPNIPTKTSDLQNDSGFITDVKVNNVSTVSGGIASLTVDNDFSTSSQNPVQNKVVADAVADLNDRIDDISAIGRFLAYWNCVIGLPVTNPTSLPYTYHTGDYFVVNNVASGSINHAISIAGTASDLGIYQGTYSVTFTLNNQVVTQYNTISSIANAIGDENVISASGVLHTTIEGDINIVAVLKWEEQGVPYIALLDEGAQKVALTQSVADTLTDTTSGSVINYKPNGTTYIGVASVTIDSTSVGVQDVYRFDGANWALAKNTIPDLSGYVATFTQSFTTIQQEQARTNIGAGTYSKPNNGIPYTDMNVAVQTSLDKADSALQEHQSLAAYRTSAAQDVIDAGKADNATVSTTAPVTLEDNHIYNLADVTTLAIAYPATAFDCVINLTTAASDTISITFPTSVYQPSAPTFTNSETWTLWVRNNPNGSGGIVTASKAVSAT